MKLTDEQLSEALSVSEDHPVLKAMGQVIDDTLKDEVLMAKQDNIIRSFPRRTGPTTQAGQLRSRISSHKSVR